MKLSDAMYRVQIGMRYKDINTDNMRDMIFVAATATDAIKRTKLGPGEYIAQVLLIQRAD